MSDGFFDLAAPAFDAVDGALAGLLPPLARVILYAVGAAWLSMAMYRYVSPQRRLRAVRRLTRSAQRRMLDDDIELDELMRRALHTLALGGRQVWMTLWPTLLIAVPLLFLLGWMSNRFDARQPGAGSAVAVCASPAAAAPLLRADVALPAPDEAGCTTLHWPAAGAHVLLSEGGTELLRLPAANAIGVVHERQWWNALFGNPIGYLPAPGAIDELRIAMPPMDLIGFGPGWLRGWMATFLVVMTALSLWLRWRWDLV